MKKALLATGIILALLLIPHNTEAQSVAAVNPFGTSYNITYSVEKTGETQVTQEILILNKQNDVIVTEYSITLNQINIFDIKVYDKKGPLDFTQEKNASSITLKAKMNNQIIGEGRKNAITVEYRSMDIAGKVGDVWNVTTPPTSDLQSIDEYNVKLIVPDVFGPEIYLSPRPANQTNDKTNTIYTFNKELLRNNGISGSFGTYQTLNFNLKYHLKNTTFFNSYQKIALPPEIKDRQSVNFQNLDPAPVSVEKDPDGNFIATYRVSPRSDVNINLVGSAKLLGKQIQPEFGGKMNELPKDLIKTYTRKQKYWEVDAEDIKKLAAELFEPENNVSQNAQAVYDYITKNLNYDFDIIKKDYIERKGALKALQEKSSWACMEFTDLFIALTRAMGIPSRELNGYAFSRADTVVPLSIDLRGGDLLHAWPEYYDPKFGWVPVDPTWGTTSGIDFFTKLDTSHFVFAVKGVNSEFPLPAGAYRFENDEKQLEVDFAQNNAGQKFEPKVEIKNTWGWNIFKMLLGDKVVEVSNKGGTVIYNVMDQKTELLPFQKISIYVKRDTKEIYYYDFNGNKLIQSF